MKNLGFLIFIFAALFLPSYAVEVSIGDILNSASDIIFGLFKNVPNVIPSITEIRELLANALFGAPLTAVLSIADDLCAIVLSESDVQPSDDKIPNITNIMFQLRTACDKQNYPVLDAETMANSPLFDKSKVVVIVASGFTTTANASNDVLDSFAKAYACRGDTNFVALDDANYINTLYTWSAVNTEIIGRHLAKGLELLTNVIPLENIHLIGHSLGAQIMSSAGRNFQNLTGKSLPYITGLDPANPCFKDGQRLPGLYRGDADFIDVVHTNPGVLGDENIIGDVDYFPDGNSPLQKGCYYLFCSHERSWAYYVESVYPTNERNFLATPCNSLESLRSGRCNGEEQPMGYAVPHNIEGIFYSEINSEEPYGPNANDNFTSTSSKCGTCKTE